MEPNRTMEIPLQSSLPAEEVMRDLNLYDSESDKASCSSDEHLTNAQGFFNVSQGVESTENPQPQKYKYEQFILAKQQRELAADKQALSSQRRSDVA